VTKGQRAVLRTALLDAAPWLEATEVGPRSVTAGPCDRCRAAPRLLPTCGPTGFEALCRGCADEEGDEAWCDGHLDDGRSARAWATMLPEHWGDAVVLWWIATGEIRGDASMTGGTPPLGEDLGPAVRAALTG
jgi:hypothetical protein